MLAFLVCAPPALAGPSQEKAKVHKQAARHYHHGFALFQKKDHARALVSFNRAYKLDPRPEMLFNIGLCHHRLGHLRQALDSYGRYLQQRPGASNYAKVKGNVLQLAEQFQKRHQAALAALKRRTAAAAATTRHPVETPVRPPVETPAKPPEETPTEPAPAKPPAEPAPAKPPAEPAPATPPAEPAPVKSPAEPAPAEPASGPTSAPVVTPPDSSPSWLLARVTRAGLQIELELGVAADTDELYNPESKAIARSDAGFALGLGIRHRPIPYLAYGVHGTWSPRAITVAFPQLNIDASGHFVGAQLGVEACPLSFSRFDPFVGVGVGYGQMSLSFDYQGENYSGALHGVTLQVSAGLRFHVTRFLSVGPVFRYFHGFWIEDCGTEPGKDTECTAVSDEPSAYRDSLPGVVFGGLVTTFHL